MSSWKHKLMRLCARVERCCTRMNSGLVAVTVVLSDTTLLLSVLRVSGELVRVEQLAGYSLLRCRPMDPTPASNR